MGHSVQCMPTPPMAPGKCYNCGIGSEDRAYYIDTGLDIDYLGVLYFCNACLGNLVAHTPDIFSRVEMEAVKRELDDALVYWQKYMNLEALLSDLGITIASLETLRELRERGTFAGIVEAERDANSESQPDSDESERDSSQQSLFEPQSINLGVTF